MIEPPVDPRSPTIMPSVSPAAREQVIAELTRRFASDELTMDEFERRAAAVYAAASPAALTALTADLGQQLPRPTLRAGQAMVIGAVLGSVVRGGEISVPDKLEVRALLGNVELDLTHATFPPGVTEIELHAMMGNIEIQLPPHVGLEDHVSTVLGSFEYRRQPRASSWTEGSKIESVVRFTGRVIMSSVEVTVRAGPDDADDDE
ncbi:MAG: hypothetical protein JWL95_3053 [Gemmatimonadetes bacterium]|nr:hypothetical protein [Gemmatimonadota bacterium]